VPSSHDADVLHTAKLSDSKTTELSHKSAVNWDDLNAIAVTDLPTIESEKSSVDGDCTDAAVVAYTDAVEVGSIGRTKHATVGVIESNNGSSSIVMDASAHSVYAPASPISNRHDPSKADASASRESFSNIGRMSPFRLPMATRDSFGGGEFLAILLSYIFW
jgi:hypothetical protein